MIFVASTADQRPWLSDSLALHPRRRRRRHAPTPWPEPLLPLELRQLREVRLHEHDFKLYNGGHADFKDRVGEKHGVRLAIQTAAFVHVLVLLAAGFALCFGESINFTFYEGRGEGSFPNATRMATAR